MGMARRRAWAYQWQLWMLLPSAVLTCFSLSCLGFFTWPCAIILLIYWARPEVKAYVEGG